MIDEITEHEHEHMTAAGAALLDQCRGKPQASKAAQAHVARWFEIAESLFDSVKGESMAGKAFHESIKPTLAACGLSLPHS